MARTETEVAILKTIAYFDLYQYPLTGAEVEKYLVYPTQVFSSIDILKALDSLIANKTLAENEGFYFLPQRGINISLRKERYLEAQKKLAIATKNSKLIARIPFVKAIFVCNDLGYLNSPIDGDIDLTIVTAKNRVWFVRFFAALLMSILRRRPTAQTRRDKICLSFFIDESYLDFKMIAYKDDIHFAFWQNQQLPIYGGQEIIDDFFNANQWSKKMLPNMLQIEPTYRLTIKFNCPLKKVFQKIFSGRIGDWLEKQLRKFQIKIMPRELINKANETNTDVIISDTILKFHLKDTRIKIKRDWLEKISQII